MSYKKIADELQNLKEIYSKIIQEHLQMRSIKKYLKKDICLEMNDKNVFIILD